MLLSLLLLSSKQNKKRQNRTEQDNTCEAPAPCSKCDSAKVLASKANSLSLEDCGNICCCPYDKTVIMSLSHVGKIDSNLRQRPLPVVWS